MLIDSHCHLPHKNYTKPLGQVVNDAMTAGVTKMVNIGTSLIENEKALEVSSQYENIYSALAIYPHEDIGTGIDILREKLEKQLLSSPKVIAVGECGIDISNWQGGRSLDEQIALLEMQLELVAKHKLPVVIHNRGGDDYIFDILDRYQVHGLKGVAHCFASSQEVAQKYLDRGFYLSFSGMITYKSRNELREVVRQVPLTRFLIETDAPYLPPEGFRGKPNEPMHVVHVARKIAEIRDMPFEKVADLSYSNTCNLFNI